MASVKAPVPAASGKTFLIWDAVILMGLLKNGFRLEVVEEAKPPEETMDIPGMKDELRRPMMLLVKAIVKI